jgi:hypothetical protein
MPAMTILKDFSQEIDQETRLELHREIDRLRALLQEVAANTFDGPMRAKINAELNRTN